jgi:ubiquinone/menaquinone biosynthesis C-methylase UbiE
VTTPSEHYVHGTDEAEQRRLAGLNRLLNRASLEAIAPRGGERVLDLGAGLGQLSRDLGRAVGRAGRVVGVERSVEQLAAARRLAWEAGEADLVDLRLGDASDPPLAPQEWGSFDLAHARFLLEHVPDPLAVVRAMIRAVRPGGRVVLEDDHDLLRLSPALPEVEALWVAYCESYRRRGKDPDVGRRLVTLLHEAGARPRANRTIFFGGCAGHPDFDALVLNFAGILQGSRSELAELGLADGGQVDRALARIAQWRRLPDAALWYSICWAEGERSER